MRDKQTDLFVVTPEYVDKILASHARWRENPDPGTKASLNHISLRTVNLSGANLHSASIANSDLSGVDLSGADLRKATLRESNLQRANLQNANLEGANLEGADLRGANIHRANLKNANLEGAIGIMAFGPVGPHKEMGYAVKHDTCVMITQGSLTLTAEKNKSETIRVFGGKVGENWAALIDAVILNISDE